jgi:hypothetical protein
LTINDDQMTRAGRQNDFSHVRNRDSGHGLYYTQVERLCDGFPRNVCFDNRVRNVLTFGYPTTITWPRSEVLKLG